MSFPPFCMNCKAKYELNIKNKKSLIWCSDYDASELGFDLDGIVGVYTCPDEDCQQIYEVMDFFIDENHEQRVIKYSRSIEENVDSEQDEPMIDTCLYCASSLAFKECNPTTDVYGTEFECDGITTTLECTHCGTIYDVVDLHPTDDIYQDIELDIRDSRTIFIR